MEAHEIVRHVQESFPSLTKRLSQITGKCIELYRSHHREPKSRNPLQSGNVSPVTHYKEYCHQYEAGVRGAGRLLNNLVHSSLEAEFADTELTQAEITVNIIDEGCDVHKWLAQFDIDTATPNQLAAFRREIGEAIAALSTASAKALAVQRVKESGLKVVRAR